MAHPILLNVENGVLSSLKRPMFDSNFSFSPWTWPCACSKIDVSSSFRFLRASGNLTVNGG
jgi:hypothetical protein